MSEPFVSDPVVWVRRAAELNVVLQQCPDADVRLAIVRKFIRGLGDHAYPCFLKLLVVIAESDDLAAKRRIAQTYAHALTRMDVPGGVLSAWGAGGIQPGQRISASSLAAPLATSSPRRSLGPLEYLTLWFGQKTQRPYLSASTYRDVLCALLGLFNSVPSLATLYPAKILADLHTAPDGSYTRQTRRRLDALANGWQQGVSPQALANAASSDFNPSLLDTPSGWLRKDL